MSVTDPAREVLAVKYGDRVTTRAEMYLNFHIYGEPDADLDIDYYFWVIRDGRDVFLVDTGFAPEVGDRRRRAHYATPAEVLRGLGIAPEEVTAVVRARMQELLDRAQRDYPDKPPQDAWWMPTHLGGTAPTPEEAAALDAGKAR